MRAEIWKGVQKLYAVGILVYFAAAGIGGVSISDFSDWASFMGRHAVYAFAWPVAAGGPDGSWRGARAGPPGRGAFGRMSPSAVRNPAGTRGLFSCSCLARDSH